MSFGNTNYRQGGTRGGADQFKWEDVKNDKYRENYLGHSVQAPVGRWQKGKDLTWYTKLSREDRAAALKEEIALAKQRDQELMDQALGIAPKKRPEPTGPLDAAEVKELLKRGAADREGLEAERVEGLGAGPVAEGLETRPKKTLAEKYEESLARGGGEDDIYALRGNVGGRSARPEEEDERSRKKAAKKQKKKEKKAKKEKKKEKKREHKHARDGDDVHDGKEPRGRGRSRNRDRGDRENASTQDSNRRHSHRSPSSSSSASSRSRSPISRRSDRRSRSPVDRDARSHRDSRAMRLRSHPRSRSRGRSTRQRSPSRSRSPAYRKRRSRSRSRSDSRDRHATRRRC